MAEGGGSVGEALEAAVEREVLGVSLPVCADKGQDEVGQDDVDDESDEGGDEDGLARRRKTRVSMAPASRRRNLGGEGRERN